MDVSRNLGLRLRVGTTVIAPLVTFLGINILEGDSTVPRLVDLGC